MTIYVVALIVAAIIIIGAVVLRRQGSQRRFTYAPAPDLLEENLVNLKQVSVVPIASPMEATEALVQRETVNDVADDMLDPRNPDHAQFVHQHPDLESDEEWITDHPHDGSN